MAGGLKNKSESREFSLMDSLRSISDIVGTLEITATLSEKISNIYLYASTVSGKVAQDVNEDKSLQRRNSDSSEIISSGNDAANRESNNNNTVTHPVFKHSHSQSCMSGCNHEHHSMIHSWKHPMSVHRSQLPLKLQEPYIEYGYFLPFMPWRYYLRTLYTPSYEMMNVWTHLIPSLYIFYLLIIFSQEIDLVTAWPLLLINLSGFVMCFFSSMAHLFHGKSSLHHSCWFVADYFGITLYAFASLTTNFYSGAQLKYYTLLSTNYLHISVIICFIGMICLSITQTNQKWISTKVARKVKVSVNGFGYMFGSLPLFQRVLEYTFYGDTPLDTSLKMHLMGQFAMLVAPIIYGLDFPQRFYPGKFDVFGHSHMWFHIITGCAVLYDINGVYYDIIEGPWDDIRHQVDYPTIYEIGFFYTILILFGIFCGHITHCSVKCDYSDEEPFLQGKLLCSCGLPDTVSNWAKNKRSRARSTPCLQTLHEQPNTKED